MNKFEAFYLKLLSYVMLPLLSLIAILLVSWGIIVAGHHNIIFGIIIGLLELLVIPLLIYANIIVITTAKELNKL